MRHRRRSPCCEIEAFRYLNEHDFAGTIPDARVAARAALQSLRERVEGLDTVTIDRWCRAAVLALIDRALE
jgi:hypothetical protein